MKNLYIFLDIEGVLSCRDTFDKLEKAGRGLLKRNLNEDDYINHNLNQDNEVMLFGGGDLLFGEYLDRQVVSAFKRTLDLLRSDYNDIKIILTSSATHTIIDDGKGYRNEKMINHFSKLFGAEIIGGDACTGVATRRYKYMLQYLSELSIQCKFDAIMIEDINDFGDKPKFNEIDTTLVTDGFVGFLQTQPWLPLVSHITRINRNLITMTKSRNTVNETNLPYLLNLFK